MIVNSRQKKKRSLEGRFSTPIFFVLWVLMFIVTGVSGMYIIRPTLLNVTPDSMLMGLEIFTRFLPMYMMIIGQGILLKLQYRWSFMRWMVFSTIGWLLIVAYEFWRMNSMMFLIQWTNTAQQALFSIPLFILAGLQAFAIKRYLRHAWIWILAMAGGLLMSSNWISLASLRSMLEFLENDAIQNWIYVSIIAAFDSIPYIIALLAIVALNNRQHIHMKSKNELSDDSLKQVEKRLSDGHSGDYIIQADDDGKSIATGIDSA